MSETVGRTECRRYLQLLCEELAGLLRPTSRSDVVVECIEAEIPTERIVHLGLIVNELVTNAAKHGAGRITVSWQRSESGGYSLSVCDEGPGLPADFDPAAGRGLGMKVIAASVQQLNGRLAFGGTDGAQGARFTILLPG